MFAIKGLVLRHIRTTMQIEITLSPIRPKPYRTTFEHVHTIEMENNVDVPTSRIPNKALVSSVFPASCHHVITRTHDREAAPMNYLLMTTLNPTPYVNQTKCAFNPVLKIKRAMQTESNWIEFRLNAH